MKYNKTKRQQNTYGPASYLYLHFDIVQYVFKIVYGVLKIIHFLVVLKNGFDIVFSNCEYSSEIGDIVFCCRSNETMHFSTDVYSLCIGCAFITRFKVKISLIL